MRASTETIVGEMQSLQELGFGTLHTRGVAQKVFCKVDPENLPDENDLVDSLAYEANFNREDTHLPRSEAAIFRRIVENSQE